MSLLKIYALSQYLNTDLKPHPNLPILFPSKVLFELPIAKIEFKSPTFLPSSLSCSSISGSVIEKSLPLCNI
jgi:hypothetical protein